MSYAAERWARSQTVGHSTAKAVLRELAFYHNGLTGLCCPSVSKIARVLEVKKADTITAAIRRLEEGGFISREFVRDPESGQILRTEYALIGFVASEWGHPKNQDTSPEYQDTSPENWGTVPQKTRGGSPEKRGEGSPKNRDVTGNKNKEIEQGKITRDIGAPDHFRDVTKKVETPKKEKRPNRWVLVDRPEGVSPEAWKNFCQIRAVKRIPLTETAWKGIEKEAAKAGLSLSETIDICNEHGWAGFKNSWLQNANRSTGSTTVRHTDPQYGIGVCQPPKEPTRMFTPEEAEETRRQMMEEGLIF